MTPNEIPAPMTPEDPPSQLTPKQLRNTILLAHVYLRIGIGMIALLFPLLLWLGGSIRSHTALQNSMSACYHKSIRDLFVGILFALGSFLYLYKGFSRKENYALNCAGVLAVGIAVFPMDKPGGNDDTTFTAPYMHTVCAIVFFLVISYVYIFRTADTLYLIQYRNHAVLFSLLYKIIGVCMIVFPCVAALLTYTQRHHFTSDNRPTIFAVELAATWIFSVYWLLKSVEIHITQADRSIPIHTK